MIRIFCAAAALLLVTACSQEMPEQAAPAPAPVAAPVAASAAAPAESAAEPQQEDEGGGDSVVLSGGGAETAPESRPAPAEERPAAAEGCIGEIGAPAARRLANQCRNVSPATRPPCNPTNSCGMLLEEIRRGCAMLGEGDSTAGCE